jgi:hypothetical protein
MGAQEDSYSAVGFLPNSESDDEEQTPLPQHHPKGLSKLQRLHLAGLYLIIVLFIVFTLMTRSTSRGPVLFIKDAFYCK